MTRRQTLGISKPYPLRVYGIILCSVFTVEAGVMLALPHLLPADRSVIFTAVLDACLLTMVLAPLVWWLIVQPLHHLANYRQRMLALVLSAQEDERRRIALDLHDGLGQLLTSLLVGLRTIEESTSDDGLQTSLRDLRLLGARTHEEIRRLARGLRPAVLDDIGLIPALERFLEEIRTSHDIEVHFEHDCDVLTRFSSHVETALYRISQEAIMNSIRHGAASRIDVALHCNSSCVELSIRDNGVGFCPAKIMSKHAKKSPFGLLSIRERARLVGGDARIESEAGAGAHVRVQLPLAGRETIDGEDSRSFG